MEEFVINGDNNFVYRIRKMNAIQLLAVKSQMSFATEKDAENTFDVALQNIEVRGANSTAWLPVRKAGEVFYMPAFLETDPESVEFLVSKFMEYLQSVFHKSKQSSEHTK